MDEGIYIGQAAELLNCNKSYLRFYESEFSLDIPRNSSNRRIYTSLELEKFRYIDKLKNDGYTNTQIKAVLNSQRVQNSSYDADAMNMSDNESSNHEYNRTADVSQLYDMLLKLRDEISDIKEMGSYREKNELQKENEILKAKLKEKTYELVEIRERLTNMKKAGQRKLFKI